MIDLYVVELAKIALSFLLALLQVDAQIASALRPW
jgi:hypothetical protein